MNLTGTEEVHIGWGVRSLGCRLPDDMVVVGHFAEDWAEVEHDPVCSLVRVEEELETATDQNDGTAKMGLEKALNWGKEK